MELSIREWPPASADASTSLNASHARPAEAAPLCADALASSAAAPAPKRKNGPGEVRIRRAFSTIPAFASRAKANRGSMEADRGSLPAVHIQANGVFRQKGPIFTSPCRSGHGKRRLARKSWRPLAEPVKVKIPAGNRKADSKLRLKGKGLPTSAGEHGETVFEAENRHAHRPIRRRAGAL